MDNESRELYNLGYHVKKYYEEIFNTNLWDFYDENKKKEFFITRIDEMIKYMKETKSN